MAVARSPGFAAFARRSPSATACRSSFADRSCDCAAAGGMVPDRELATLGNGAADDWLESAGAAPVAATISTQITDMAIPPVICASALASRPLFLPSIYIFRAEETTRRARLTGPLPFRFYRTHVGCS